MAIRKSVGEKSFDIINTALLVIIGFVCLYPLVHVAAASFSDPAKLMGHRGILMYPLGFTLKGYSMVLRNPNIYTGYFNTLIYVVGGTILNMLLTTLSAYVLSRTGLMWGKVLTVMVTITMFFDGGMIPRYLVVQGLHLIDTRWAIILPTAISVWNLIIMRTAMQGVPASLEESARIDGAKDFTILFRIVVPLIKSTMAVMVLFYAVSHWNSWFNAMIYLRSRKYFPLQLILREILLLNDTSNMIDVTDMTMIAGDSMYSTLIEYCTVIVATVPILFIYPFLQKYFVKGVMVGAVKG